MNRLMIKNKNSQPNSKFLSVFLSFALFGLSALLVANSVKSVITAYQRIQLIDQANEEVGELRYRNLELQEDKDEILESSYVEAEARDRLYYVKDGEMMIMLPEDEDVMGESDESESEDEDGDEGDGWEIWWDLLLNGV